MSDMNFLFSTKLFANPTKLLPKKVENATDTNVVLTKQLATYFWILWEKPQQKHM